MKTKITHFTNSPVNQKASIKSGRIELEGHNVFSKYVGNLSQEEQLAKYSITLSSKAMGGRLLWFTEEDSCNTTGSTSEEAFAFPFYAEDIKATKWTDFRKRFLGKKDSREYIIKLENIAIEQGDNPKKWWVSTKPIPLTHCIQLPPKWSPSLEWKMDRLMGKE